MSDSVQQANAIVLNNLLSYKAPDVTKEEALAEALSKPSLNEAISHMVCWEHNRLLPSAIQAIGFKHRYPMYFHMLINEVMKAWVIKHTPKAVSKVASKSAAKKASAKKTPIKKTPAKKVVKNETNTSSGSDRT